MAKAELTETMTRTKKNGKSKGTKTKKAKKK